MPKTDVGFIAEFGTACAKLWHKYLETKDRRRLRAANEAAESFIHIHYRDGEYKQLDSDRRTKLLLHYRKRFFHYD